MVLGMKSKQKKGPSIKVTYGVNVLQIRPWPPSESLKSVQTVLLHWENGTTDGSFLSVAGDSEIVFNESFALPSILYKKASDKFRKNKIEFSLFKPHKDKVKGQLLGTATVNLADYGLFEDKVYVNAPMNFKKVSDDASQPALFITLELLERYTSPSSSPGSSFSKDGILNYDGYDSMTSWTDDDASSHSSRTTGSLSHDAASASPSLNEKNEHGYPDHKFRSMSFVQKGSVSTATIRPSPSISFRDANGKSNAILSGTLRESLVHGAISNVHHETNKINQQSVKDKILEGMVPEALSPDHYKNFVNPETAYSLDKRLQRDGTLTNDALSRLLNGKEKIEQKDTALARQLIEEAKSLEDQKLYKRLTEAASKIQAMSKSDTLIPDRKGPPIPPSGNSKAPLKHAKTIQICGALGGTGLQPDIFDAAKPKDIYILNASQNKGKPNAVSETEEPKTGLSNSSELKIRVEVLEEELREAAALEVSLYAIVPEHSNSPNKVHAPARRLARFYTNAAREGPQSKRASAARAALSGLILVSKTCGSDVPRLTFWLSNSIMLRAIVTEIAAGLPHYNGAGPEFKGSLPDMRADPPRSEGPKYRSVEEVDDWEDVMTLIIALEKVESWLFSRIVESLWWQAFTPYMQPASGKGSLRSKGSRVKKTTGRRNVLGSQEYETVSMELWKKAFKDACERICPVRAAGHECGCLSALVILVMEQLVNRLDVAMFNAILRESVDEIPTDPISDPISDIKVLPVPPGKSSFTSGAQLKNAIGNWSRWLSDLFGLEDDPTEDNGVLGNGKGQKSFKAFRLLHALSDLMMIPFGILVDTSTRKEVCPAFGSTIIKRVLNNFVPDEFCPDPIPRSFLNFLDTEDVSDQKESMITTLPCTAGPTRYSPPPAALLTCVGEVGSQVLKSSRLSSLKKSYGSDDEVDEVESPLTSIIPDSYLTTSALAKLSSLPKAKGGQKVVRYQMLREVWVDEDE